MSVKYPEHQTTGFALNEADTCRKHVIPKLQAAGWYTERSISFEELAEQHRQSIDDLVKSGCKKQK